jgi:serine/threonine protein kinase
MTPEQRRQVESIVEAALALQGPKRATYLERACGSDPELRREVESLLAQESRAGEFLEQPAVEQAVRAIASDKPGSLIGRQFGHYRIESLLGAGGMGEVYRAHDTKLGRDVALKVLPEAFAHDAERMARFAREAQVLASLNHPNIATIHGLEESGGVRALVMEVVEGPTLAERIGHRAMPLDEALPIAKQIAEGLEYAHEKGIVHRDLKPANVKLTADGNVKILDFGLAKALDNPIPMGNPSISPTLTIEGTRAGVILGTAAYMSPEQARGAIVDKRADIWAFGVVLYEMLTGKQPFAGETVSDTLAAVLKTEPEWDAVPLPIRALVRRCLAKDPRLRLRDIGDARLALAEIGSAEDTPPKPAPKGTLWKIAAGVLAVSAAVAVWALWRSPRPASQPLVRITEDQPEFASPVGNHLGNVLLSPDGTRLVYTRRESEGKFRLYTRTLDQEQAAAIPGTEDASFPFFSPDGQSLGFFANGKLKKTSVSGGGTVELCDAPDGRGGSWGEDGNIVAALKMFSGLSRIPSGGGTAQPLTQLKNEATHRWPQVLPGAQAVLFTANARPNSPFEDASIEVLQMRTGERKTLVRGGHHGRWAASGHLLYAHLGTLYAAPMDGTRLELTGPAMPVVEALADDRSTAYASVDISRSGTLVFVKGKIAGLPLQTLVWLESGGRTQPLGPGPARYESFHFSPDGRRLAMSIYDDLGRNSDIWIYEPERNITARLTHQAGANTWPTWTPDGKHIVFSSDRHGGSANLYWMRSDGAGEPVRLTESRNPQFMPSFSPDGRWLAFQQSDAQTQADIWTVPLEDVSSDHPKVGKPEPFLRTPFQEFPAGISPDGHWIVYESNESGQSEVYVRPFPGPGGKWQISAGGGFPFWSSKGQELFYPTTEGIMAVSYSVKGDKFVAGKPRQWAAKKNLGNLDLAPDGKRFAAALNEESNQKDPPRPIQVTFLLNFFDELRRRVPVGGK